MDNLSSVIITKKNTMYTTINTRKYVVNYKNYATNINYYLFPSLSENSNYASIAAKIKNSVYNDDFLNKLRRTISARTIVMGCKEVGL